MTVRNSVEYLKFYLLSNLADDIHTDTVVAALQLESDDPDAYTWLPCTFISSSVVSVIENGATVQKNRTDWRTTTVVTYSDTNYPLGRYGAYAKVSDTPEAPITKLGVVSITR